MNLLSRRFLRVLGVTLLACGLFHLLFRIADSPVGVPGFAISAALGIALQRLLVVRLPLFRDFNRIDPFAAGASINSLAAARALTLGSGLLAGAVAAGLQMAFAGVMDVEFAFNAGVAASGMSLYRE